MTAEPEPIRIVTPDYPFAPVYTVSVRRADGTPMPDGTARIDPGPAAAISYSMYLRPPGRLRRLYRRLTHRRNPR